MPSFDFTHPNKFTASLGVGLIFAAIAFPWLLWQSSSVLTLPQKSVRDLPPEAQRVIEQRVHIMLRIQDFMGWISLGLALLGIILLLVGLLRWDKFQRTQDEAATIKAEKDIEGSRPMSDAERKQTLDEEVAESLGVSQETPVEGSGKTDHITPTQSHPDHAIGPQGHTEDPKAEDLPIPRNTYDERRKKIAMIESLLAEKSRFAYESNFQVDSQRRMDTGGRVDLLLTPSSNENNAQIAFDFKYSDGRATPTDDLSILRLAISTRDLKKGTINTGFPGNPPIAKANAVQIVVVCLADRVSTTPTFRNRTFDQHREYLKQRRDTVNSVLQIPVAQVILQEDELPDLNPVELRRRVTEALKDPSR